MMGAERSQLRGTAQIVSLLRREGSLTRNELIELADLSRSTVGQRLEELVAAGLVVEAGDAPSTGGRRARKFRFNSEIGSLLVIDMTASRMRVSLRHLDGTTMAETATSSDVSAGPERSLDSALKLYHEISGEVEAGVTGGLLGVALGVPGPVEFEHARVVSPPIMRGWDRFDIRGFFAQHLPCPVLVENDVNAIAAGLHRTAYPDTSHLLAVKVGTGVGCGIIASGELLRGALGAAGDIGHIRLTVDSDEPEPLCVCGNVGCVEAYVGGWALRRDLVAEGRNVEGVQDVVKLIQAGDALAVHLARRAGRVLGQAVAHAVSLLNPQMVVFAGPLGVTSSDLLVGVRELVYQRALPLATNQLRLERSTLGLEAGSLGLAALLTDELVSDRYVGHLIGRIGA